MKDLFTTTLGRFRLVAILEGISVVLLFGVAMPLKYGFDIPGPTRIIGGIHGALVVIYMFALISAWLTQSWPFKKAIWAFVASIVPLGTFYFEYKIRDEVPAESLHRP